MVQVEYGLESGCKCPDCGNMCRDCMGSEQPPMSPMELKMQMMMRMREVIAATLLGLDGIEAVNVLIAGREEGLFSLPAGAVSNVHDDLTAAWTRLSCVAWAAQYDSIPCASASIAQALRW